MTSWKDKDIKKIQINYLPKHHITTAFEKKEKSFHWKRAKKGVDLSGEVAYIGKCAVERNTSLSSGQNLDKSIVWRFLKHRTFWIKNNQIQPVKENLKSAEADSKLTNDGNWKKSEKSN